MSCFQLRDFFHIRRFRRKALTSFGFQRFGRLLSLFRRRLYDGSLFRSVRAILLGRLFLATKIQLSEEDRGNVFNHTSALDQVMTAPCHGHRSEMRHAMGGSR